MESFEWDPAFESGVDLPAFSSVPCSSEVKQLFTELSGAPLQTRRHDVLPTQVMTPPASDAGSASDIGDRVEDSGITPANTIVSVSTTFHPAAQLLSVPPDLVLASSDEVFFYVHATRVLSVSSNYFNGTAAPNLAKPDTLKPVARLPENATVLNIILHTAYGIPCAHYKPTLDTLVVAIDAMPTYGLSPKVHVAPSTPLFTLVLNQAPMQPLVVYALAARHDLYELARPVSGYLLSFPLDSFTDELAATIGAVYLKRLFLLHLARLDALKRLLLPPPHPHPPTEQCDFAEQKKLTRAWALAASYVAWDARADLPPSAIQNALLPLADHVSCELCKQSLADRVKHLLVQWSFVRSTI